MSDQKKPNRALASFIMTNRGWVALDQTDGGWDALDQRSKAACLFGVVDGRIYYRNKIKGIEQLVEHGSVNDICTVYVDDFAVVTRPNSDGLMHKVIDDAYEVTDVMSAPHHDASMSAGGVPSGAETIISYVCKPDRLEAVLGDLQRNFTRRAAKQGEEAARRWYWWQTARTVVAFGVESSVKVVMLREFLGKLGL